MKIFFCKLRDALGFHITSTTEQPKGRCVCALGLRSWAPGTSFAEKTARRNVAPEHWVFLAGTGGGGGGVALPAPSDTSGAYAPHEDVMHVTTDVWVAVGPMPSRYLVTGPWNVKTIGCSPVVLSVSPTSAPCVSLPLTHNRCALSPAALTPAQNKWYAQCMQMVEQAEAFRLQHKIKVCPKLLSRMLEGHTGLKRQRAERLAYRVSSEGGGGSIEPPKSWRGVGKRAQLTGTMNQLL